LLSLSLLTYLSALLWVPRKNGLQKINAFHSVALHGVAEAMGKGVAL
jgi:hypothetical protein